MMDYAQIESNKFSLNFDEFDVLDCIKSVVSLMSIKAKAKQIKLSAPCAYNMIAITDENRLKQIIINLVSNAIKFTP